MYDRTLYACERTEAKAADGTLVPVSLVYRRDLKQADAPQPLFLYAYGSYGACMEPSFGANRLPLLDRGVVYAIAHIRGGGEMGRSWYEDEGKCEFLRPAETLTLAQSGVRSGLAMMSADPLSSVKPFLLPLRPHQAQHVHRLHRHGAEPGGRRVDHARYAGDRGAQRRRASHGRGAEHGAAVVQGGGGGRAVRGHHGDDGGPVHPTHRGRVVRVNTAASETAGSFGGGRPGGRRQQRAGDVRCITRDAKDGSSALALLSVFAST